MAPSCGRDLVALRTATDVPTAHAHIMQGTRPAPLLHNHAVQTVRINHACAGVAA